MSECNITIEPALPCHHGAVEAVLDGAFGLSRHIKTSYRFREGETAVEGLSFIAKNNHGELVGAISFWHLKIGASGDPALLLGPLAVAPHLQGKGIGLKLMRHGIAAAGELGHNLIILVGDEPYYARVGFARVPHGQLVFPGPVDPERLLFLNLETQGHLPVQGLVLPPHRFADAIAAKSTAFAVPHHADE